MHFFQKKSKAFRVFFVMRKEAGAVLDGENLGSSLQKNNSCVSCCFSVFHVLLLVQSDGLGSVVCSSVHLACVFLKVNGNVVIIQFFVCVGTVLNVCKLWGFGVSGLAHQFNPVLWGPSGAGVFWSFFVKLKF